MTSCKTSVKWNNVISVPIYVGKAIKSFSLRVGHLVKWPRKAQKKKKAFCI